MSEWVSVNHRLPEPGVRVLAWVCDHRGRNCPSALVYQDSMCQGSPPYWDGDGPMSWSAGDVTHWMPLPEPPSTLTVKEALREAIRVLNGVKAARKKGLLGDNLMWWDKRLPSLPRRLRAALESEE